MTLKEGSLLVFDREEQWAAYLPGSFPINLVIHAFSMAWKADLECRESFKELLYRDAEMLTDRDMDRIQSYPAKIKKLDKLSFQLGELAAPRMVDMLLAKL